MNNDRPAVSPCRIFVAVASAQVSRLADFYTNISTFIEPKGDKILPSPNSPSYAEFSLGGLKLAIFEPNSAHAEEFSQISGGSMSLCMEVCNLEAAIAHLTTLGYPPPGNIIHASHGREIYAYDPDGNRLILHQS